MLEGILDIRLLPPWSPSSVKSDLVAALSRADHLQAGIGFWTIDHALLGSHLSRKLREASGFACVDLHPPTDVDALASVASQGAHIRIYYEDIPTYTDAGRKEPPCLLHSKLLLFRSTDKTAELWVGSHNWTNRAILGLNLESSIVIRLRDTAPLFRAAAGYLAEMREISEPFDLRKVDEYKAIQRKVSNGLSPVIELEAKDGEGLDDATVEVFGAATTELTKLGTIRRDVHVVLIDPDSNEQHIYPASIVHSGLLAASDASAAGISFSPRRCAFRRGRTFPTLEAEGPVDQNILDSARYFVTLHLGARQTALVADAPAPHRVVLQEVAEEMSPLLRRLDPGARQYLFRGRAPRVKRPLVLSERQRVEGLVLSERERAEGVVVPKDAGCLKTVEAQRSSHEHPLVSMRVLRPKSVDA